jgi:hydrogenase maturation protease
MSAASTSEAAARGGPPEPGTGRTIVVGLGNPILGDDGAGWRVADAVAAGLASRPADDPRLTAVTVEQLAVGGLTLMEHLVGYSRAILVDALVTGADPPGTVRRRRLDSLPGREAGHVDSAHDATLGVALEAGRLLGADVPADVEVVTIEAVRVLELTETLTPEVAAAIPVAVVVVLELLGA